jgi:uncharacterized membrane protein YphA (DoxX/SURF4 family)
MKALRSIVDRFIFEEYKTSASSLGICRILYAANMLLVILPQHLWISEFPDSFFDPPIGMTMFFTRFPSHSFFLVVNGFSILAAICLLFGYRTRIASTGLVLLLLTGYSWAYSFGKINHNIFEILVPLVTQFAGWGNDYSIDAQRLVAAGKTKRETNAWPVALLALIVGLAMMTSASAKATSGWLNPRLHAVQAHVIYNDVVTGRSTWLAEQLLRIRSGVFWKTLDYSTVLIEAGFLLTVVRRRALRVVCALACFLHLGIALTMEIAYTDILIAYAVFCDWSTFEFRVGYLLTAWNQFLGRISPRLILICAAILTFVYFRFGNPFQFHQEWDPVGVGICILSAFIATVFLVGMVRDWLLKPTNASC